MLERCFERFRSRIWQMIVKKGKKHLQKNIVSNSVTFMNWTSTVDGENKLSCHFDMVRKYLDLSKPWFCKYMYGRKKRKKRHVWLSWAWLRSGQNGGPYFSFFVRQWPSLWRKIVEIYKFCCHGNVTSHFTLLAAIRDSLKSWGFLLLTAPHIVFLIRDLFCTSWHFQARIKINNKLQQLFPVWLLPRSLPVPVQLHLFPRSCWPRVSGLCLKRICIKLVQIGQLHLLRAKQE